MEDIFYGIFYSEVVFDNVFMVDVLIFENCFGFDFI